MNGASACQQNIGAFGACCWAVDSKITPVANAQKQHTATSAACLVKLMVCVQRLAMSPGQHKIIVRLKNSMINSLVSENVEMLFHGLTVLKAVCCMYRKPCIHALKKCRQ